MRDLLYSIYVLVILYCALTIIYEFFWDDAQDLKVKTIRLETDHAQDGADYIQNEICAIQSTFKTDSRLARASLQVI